MVSTGTDDTNANPVALVPASVPINDIDTVTGVEIIDSTLAIDLPYLYKRTISIGGRGREHVTERSKTRQFAEMPRQMIARQYEKRGSFSGFTAASSIQHTSGVIGLFTGPHQMSFSELGSCTTRLSDGERPVLAPEYADRAPEDVIAEPVSYTRASS